MLLKIHDFSENYNCLLPEEIHILHWTLETAKLCPMVVLRKVNDEIREDHITFLSDDKKHDVPFVELCNSCLHKHYKNEGLVIEHDIEYNDGCASQFKSTRAFSAIVRRNIKTTRIFCKTSPDKSVSDGLGGIAALQIRVGQQSIIANLQPLITHIYHCDRWLFQEIYFY